MVIDLRKKRNWSKLQDDQTWVSYFRRLEVSSKLWEDWSWVMGCETEWNCDVVQPKQFQTACGWFPRRGMLKIRETDSSFLPPRYLGGCWHKGENASSKVNTQGNTEQGKTSQKKKTFLLGIAKMGRGPPLPKLILKLLIFEVKTKVKKLAKLLHYISVLSWCWK